MALTHVELYEALKPSIGEAAAAMIAEVVPPAGERTDMRAEHLRTIKWIVGIFAPMLVGTWATLVAAILRV